MATQAPLNQHLADALGRDETIASLMRRLQQSQARFAAIRSRVPPPLLAHTRAGSLDDKAWMLLADNAAAAAKLRQLAPELQAVLAAAGWPEPPIRIKVSPPR